MKAMGRVKDLDLCNIKQDAELNIGNLTRNPQFLLQITELGERIRTFNWINQWRLTRNVQSNSSVKYIEECGSKQMSDG